MCNGWKAERKRRSIIEFRNQHNGRLMTPTHLVLERDWMEGQLGMVWEVRPSIDKSKPHKASFMPLITKPHTADISIHGISSWG